MEARLDLVWPATEGRYEIVVDLSVAGIRWFEEWNGVPLAARQVRVVEPDEES